jgi:hypothetical protein
MKIGILTFHEIYNPGAFLQAYGSQTLLQEMGHHAEIIDYNPPNHRYHPITHAKKIGWRLPLRWRTWLDAYLRDRAFAKARSSHLTISPIFKHRSEIASKAYDAVLVGADIVWNFKEKRLGQDPVYFGEGINAKKLIAFAPSCGNCSVTDPIPDYMSSGLKQFSALSVRDKNTADVVEKAISHRPQIICDPSFHLIDELGLPKKAPAKDYILVYLLPGQTSDELINEIKKLSLTKKLPIYAVYYRHKWANRNVMKLGPFEWLQLIRAARYVFTNTFHGTIFSAFMRSDFIVEMNDLIRNKTLDMVLSCDLKYRLYNGEQSVSKLLQKPIDYNDVHDYFRKQARVAKIFLLDALNSET